MGNATWKRSLSESISFSRRSVKRIVGASPSYNERIWFCPRMENLLLVAPFYTDSSTWSARNAFSQSSRSSVVSISAKSYSGGPLRYGDHFTP